MACPKSENLQFGYSERAVFEMVQKIFGLKSQKKCDTELKTDAKKDGKSQREISAGNLSGKSQREISAGNLSGKSQWKIHFLFPILYHIFFVILVQIFFGSGQK